VREVEEDDGGGVGKQLLSLFSFIPLREISVPS
jgi:hypothetical protein